MINKKIYLVLVIIVSFLSSCIDYNLTEPEVAVYNPNLTANTTIEELRSFLGSSDLVAIDDSVIIVGTVVANDKSGNLYKSIVIQDSTGGVSIDINSYGLHNKYHVGDLVYVKCKGLYVGDYGGHPKLGSEYEGGVGRIAYTAMDDYLFKSDGGEPIEPKELFLNTINANYINQLVVINNVQFQDTYIGGTYSNAELSEDKDIVLENFAGNTMIVRTSGYADFARDIIPEGKGSIIGILNDYNGTKQLTIRDVEEVDMNKSRIETVFSESFSSDLGDFTTYSVTGSQNWYYSSPEYGIVMSGYSSGTNYENEDWLISSAINLTDYTSAYLSFSHAINYLTVNGYDDTKVYICNDYDGVSDPNTSGTWTQLTGFGYPPGDNWDFKSSGNINISDFGNTSSVFIAFKYTSSIEDGCTWEVKNFAIKSND